MIVYYCILWVSLRFEKYRWNIDNFRRLIEKISLFFEPKWSPILNPRVLRIWFWALFLFHKFSSFTPPLPRPSYANGKGEAAIAPKDVLRVHASSDAIVRAGGGGGGKMRKFRIKLGGTWGCKGIFSKFWYFQIPIFSDHPSRTSCPTPPCRLPPSSLLFSTPLPPRTPARLHNVGVGGLYNLSNIIADAYHTA